MAIWDRVTTDSSSALPYDWQAPPAGTRESLRLSWINSTIEEGQAWLKTQRGSSDFNKALDTFAGRDTLAQQINYRSHVDPNRLKRNVREVVGALSQIRPIWGYYAENRAFSEQAEMMNKVVRAWYLKMRVADALADSLRWTAATCRGWLSPVYRRDMYGTGRGNLHVDTYGAPSVLPVQLPQDGDFQNAYSVTILKELPVAMAHGMFPSFQHLLRPSSSRYWYASDMTRKASQGNLLRRMFGRGARDHAASTELSDLLVPFAYTYVIDLTMNTTGTNPKTAQEIPMGEPGSSWFYRVPYVGQDIPAGRDADGRPLTRKADENDARLYPRRRLIISSPDRCITYDGPAFDWHGMFPGVSFCFDPWPWEPIGFSLVHDGYQLNESLKKLYRGIDDKVSAAIKPGLIYDTQVVSKREAMEFDPMQPASRAGFDGSAGVAKPFDLPLPPEMYRIDPAWAAHAQQLETALDAQMAISDLRALMKSRAAGAMNDIEKILEANGPIVEAMSRSMEPPMTSLGHMVKYDILQYYSSSKVMAMIGPDNMTLDTFDFDPTSLVPSHLPGENVDHASAHSPIDRARVFADNLEFQIMPGTLHEITQMQMKLGLIQLRKAGVKISSETIAKSWQVPNYGSFDGSTEIEKWENEQERDLWFASRMKQELEAVGLAPPPGAAAPQLGKKNPEGRPPSGQAAPALVNKPGEGRSTITESK